MKTFNEVMEEWKKDGVIDRSDLTAESLKPPILHGKYWAIYEPVRRRLAQLRAERKSLLADATDLLDGAISKETLDKRGWTMPQRKYAKVQYDAVIGEMPDIKKIDGIIAEQETLVAFLEDVIKQINNRNFYVGNAIKWEMFLAGINSV